MIVTAATFPARPEALAEPGVSTPVIVPTIVRALAPMLSAIATWLRELPDAFASPPMRESLITPVELMAEVPTPIASAVSLPVVAVTVAEFPMVVPPPVRASHANEGTNARLNPIAVKYDRMVWCSRCGKGTLRPWAGMFPSRQRGSGQVTCPPKDPSF
jgi:hypothetical protein